LSTCGGRKSKQKIKLFRNKKKLHVGTKEKLEHCSDCGCGNSETVLWQVGKKVDLRQLQVGKTE